MVQFLYQGIDKETQMRNRIQFTRNNYFPTFFYRKDYRLFLLLSPSASEFKKNFIKSLLLGCPCSREQNFSKNAPSGTVLYQS